VQEALKNFPCPSDEGVSLENFSRQTQLFVRSEYSLDLFGYFLGQAKKVTGVTGMTGDRNENG